VAKYWLQSTDPSIPNVIAVCEADDIASITASLAVWDDVFDITAVPAVTSEEGLEELAQQMMQSQQG
jgi:hypothetical protein